MPRLARLVTRALGAALLVMAATARAQPALDSLVPPSPVPNGFIADGGPVLDAAALGRLNARIIDVQRRTGGDIAVAILRDLHGRAPSDVGVAIYRGWKIGRVDSLGSARRNLGALLLIVPKELAPTKRGECWITTGRGAEATLIDAVAGTICRDSVIPRLRTKAYEPAIAAGVDGIGAALVAATQDLAPPTAIAPPIRSSIRTGRSPAKRYMGMGLLGGALLLGGGGAGIVTMRSYRRRKPRDCPRGHGPMIRLPEDEDDAALTRGQALEERLGSVDYDVWACRVCEERIVIPYKRSSPYQGCPQCGHATVRRRTATLREATTFTTGLQRVTLDCANCSYHHETQRITPQLPPPSPPGIASSDGGSWGGGGGGGGDSGGSSFGGSGETSGGGGGDSY